LHGAQACSIQKLEHCRQESQDRSTKATTASDSLAASSIADHTKAAVPIYLSRLITARVCGHTLPCSAAVQQGTSDLSGRAFCCSAPSSLNSLPNIVSAANSLTSCKSRLKTYLFNQTFSPTCRARFAGEGGCRGPTRLEKPRPRLENISKNAAGVAF